MSRKPMVATLLATLVLVPVSIHLAKKNYFGGATTEAACASAGDKDHCAIWDDKHKKCRKGVLSNGVCNAKRDVVPVVLFSIGMVSFIAYVVLVLHYMRRKIKQP